MTSLVQRLPEPARRAVLRVLPRSTWARLRPIAHGSTTAQVRVRRFWHSTFLSSQRRSTLTASVIGLDANRSWVARPVSSFSSVEILAEHLALVANALEVENVDYIVLDAEPNRRRTVVVTSRMAEAALTAMEKHLAGRGVYYQDVTGHTASAARLVGHRSLPRSAARLRFFQVSSTLDGEVLSRDELACVLELWRVTTKAEPAGPSLEMVPKGSWVAAVPGNIWADIVAPEAQQVTTAMVDGHRRPVLSVAAGAPHADSITFPVDVVYTWVDGSDPDWQVRKNETLRAMGEARALNAYAANASRFQSRDELRYSLRSLEMFAGWVRHVYIVTDRQMPSWLDVSHPKVSVVDHRDLFGNRGRLPTFNSHAIESQLHHIDGLSEQFLYLNDDIFFGRPVEPRRFFLSNGTGLSFPSRTRIAFGPATTHDAPVTSAAKNARRLSVEASGRQPMNKFKHAPQSMRRSVLAEIEQRFPVEHKLTSAAQFRTRDDVSIPSSLAHHYGYLTGRMTPGAIRYLYADIAQPKTEERLGSLLRRHDVDVFCLNDHDSAGVDPVAQSRMLQDFLNAYFPLRSRFELDRDGD